MPYLTQSTDNSLEKVRSYDRNVETSYRSPGPHSLDRTNPHDTAGIADVFKHLPIVRVKPFGVVLASTCEAEPRVITTDTVRA